MAISASALASAAPAAQPGGGRRDNLTTRMPDNRTLAVSATFTAEPVEPALAFWLNLLELPFTIEFAPYNQVLQQLLDPASLVSSNRTGLNVLLIRLDDLERSRTVGRSTSEEFAQALRTSAGRNPSPYLVFLCTDSPQSLASPGYGRFAREAQEIITSAVAALPGVHVVAASELEETYPVARSHNSYTEELGHVPYTEAYFAALAGMIARKLHALRNPPYKVIALDCDQVIWKGVCGEDGPQGVELDRPRRELQEFLVRQRESGMLLCLCSRNNERDVEEVFASRSMPLARELITASRINWRPKSENLESLAQELHLGLDSFIFIDDNPVECAEVSARHPEILTLQFPKDAPDIRKFIRHVWAFDRLRISEEDRKRALAYEHEKGRTELRHKAMSLKDFLEGLNLRIRISEMEPGHLARVSQLTLRTNRKEVSSGGSSADLDRRADGARPL